MGASNQTGSNANYYKLKESEVNDDSKGQFRFFKQEKSVDKWVDGEGFNSMSGRIVNLQIREFEWQGEKKKALELTFDDVGEKSIVTLGMRSSAANNILNTLAGGNGFEISMFCGKPKEKDGKYYPTLYINKSNVVGDEKKTNWKYQPSEFPKVTTITDDEGNKIKKGQKAADEFWLNVASGIQKQLGGGESSKEKEVYHNPDMTLSEDDNGMVDGNDPLPF